MAKTRAFISFDYDHDSILKEFLVGQAKLQDSPFEIADWSVKQAQAVNWQDHAEMRIKRSDVLIVICGQHTDTATGVSVEINLAKKNSIPFFLLKGYSDKTCKWPKAASTEKMYNWTWENLKRLLRGDR